MTELKEGDQAPEFEIKNEEGKTMRLSDFSGQRLIIFFYPKDLTPGCITESCNLRDNYEDLRKKGFEVVGVSADNEKRHRKFIDKYNLPFSLLADTEKKMINDYGVWGLKKFMGRQYEGIRRTTFVIDGNGIIEKIIKQVTTKDHTKQIVEELKN